MMRSPLVRAFKRLCFLLVGLLLVVLPGLLGMPNVAGLAQEPGAIAQAPATPPAPETALDLYWQGYYAYQANQLETAINRWQRSLTLYIEAADLGGERAVLSALGTAYLDLGDYAAAVFHLEAFRSNMALVGDEATLTEANRLALAQGLSNLGVAYQEMGRYARAVESQETALRLMQSLGPTYAAATGQVWSNLGNVYAALGDYEAAIAAHQESRAIAQTHTNPVAEAEALSNLGVLSARQGRAEEAIDYYLQSLVLFDALEAQVEDPSALQESRAHLLLNLASAYHAQDDLARAAAFYTQSLRLAQTVGDRALEAMNLSGLGLLQEDQGEAEAGIALQRQGLAMAETVADPFLEAMMLNNLGHSLFNQGDYREAESRLRRAIDLLESLRPGLADLDSISLFDSQVFSYNLLQQILVARGKYAAALEVSEQGRARAFVQLLLRRTNQTSVTDLPPAAPTIDEIRAIAQRQNATLVEYAIVADDDFKFQGRQRGREAQLYIWVIQPSGKLDFRQVDLRPLWEANPQNNSLTNLVESSRRSIGVRSEAAPNLEVNTFNWRRLQDLHTYLIKPIADLLPADPTDPVIVIPQDALFLVPFSALQDAEGHFLIESHTLLMAPSIQVIGLAQSQEPSAPLGTTENQDSILLVGNPTMPAITYQPDEPPTPLAPLPGAEQEVREIARLLNVPYLLGSAATEPVVRDRMPQARIIHLATHGLLTYGQTSTGRGQDMPGAIALAPQTPSTPATDGLLTTAEILDLQLSANLVVLSACNTGRGEITGDGVIGLSRSFLSAGASSIVVSLWAVSDESTAFVMTRFYENLLQGQGKAQALRQAMLAANAEYNHPFDWAAFTLIGEAQ